MLSEVVKEGWRGLLLPVIILVPFILDYFFKDSFYTSRLGETGAEYFSNSLLFFIAGVATIYTMVVVKDKKQVTLSAIADLFAGKVRNIVPIIAVCLFGYMFGALFTDLNIAEGLEQGMAMLNMGKIGICIMVPLITGILGIAIVGSSMIVVFGPVFVSIFAAVGVNPLLAAAMLPCICGVMSNMVPPIAPAFLAGVTLADADFGKAVKNDLWWILTEYIMEVIVLVGVLPIFGL